MNAIVTGASSGIGAALAQALRSAGHFVEEVNRDTADFANMRHVLRWRPKSIAQGELDLFVNNAGIMPLVDYQRTSYDQWEAIMGVNLRAPFFLTQTALRYMRHGGCIVNVASVAGLQPDPEEIAYSVSKAGIIMFSRCLARRMAGTLRVVTVSPGFVDTELVPGDLPDSLLQMIPVKREATPAEIAQVIIDATSWPYVNGAHIVIDGGLLAACGGGGI